MPSHQYKITISDLRFSTIVGILDEERVTPQEVIADIEIEYLKEAGEFINYAEVAQLVEQMMQTEKFLLLEDALAYIVEKIKCQFPTVLTIKLKLLKPDILDNCRVGVEIFKKY